MNTQERIKQILDELKLDELSQKILQLELENLVIQAQLEQLESNNYETN